MEEAGENSNLKLIFEKGPRKGETLDCPHGSTVCIGRIIRGNTFAIKDPAISQKHLIIQSDGQKWCISDLDTSNGTLINDIKLQPDSPFQLSNGDNIKIGSTTSIAVRIARNIEAEISARPQRNTRRRAAAGRARVSKDEIGLSESNMGLEAANVEDGRVCRDEAGAGENVSSIVVKVEENVSLEEIDPPRRNPRRRAALGAGNSVKLRSAAVVDEGSHVKDDVGVGGETKSSAANVEEKADTGIPPLPRNTRRRAAATKGKASRKEESPLESNLITESCRESEKVDGAAAIDENSLCGEDAGVGDKRKDLENITLGEWFDRMEKYLPRKINEAAEEIIASLRQRQKQFEEFIGEHHHNEKGKLPVAY